MMEGRGRIPVGPPVNKPLPSYWQDPKSPLANVVEPEVDNTTQPYDYAVIGSGISGTLIAHNIIKRNLGARVVLVEAREICSGATGRNGGHTKAASYRTYLQHVRELGKDEALKIARLEYENIIDTHSLARELDIECESHLCNTVDLIYDAAAFENGKTAIQALCADATAEERKQGKMADYSIHDKPSALTLFPISPSNNNTFNASPEALAGAFSYPAGRIHAYRFTTGILKTLVHKGLQICANTPVHDILPSSPTTPDAKQPLWDIFTQHNIITAGNVILATNGYTSYLLSQMKGSIVPLRGQITAQRPGEGTTLPCPLETTFSFIYKEGYEYMIPRPREDGTQHIIIGGGLGRLANAGASEYGTVDDSRLNPRVSQYLRGTLTGLFGKDAWGHDDEETRVVQEWTGIMGATADGRPFVGQVPGQKGLWISAGFNGHGMVLCLKSAEALVNMMVDGKKPVWFPDSFLVGEERLKEAKFAGRTDMQSTT